MGVLAGGHLIPKVGSFAISLLQELSSVTWMLGKTISEIEERISKHRTPFRQEDLFYQTNRVSWQLQTGPLPVSPVPLGYCGRNRRFILWRYLLHIEQLLMRPHVALPKTYQGDSGGVVIFEAGGPSLSPNDYLYRSIDSFLIFFSAHPSANFVKFSPKER